MYEINQCKRCLKLKLGLIVGVCFLSLIPFQVRAKAEMETQSDERLTVQQQLVRNLIAAEIQQLQTPQAAKSIPVKAQKISTFDGPDLILRAVYGVDQRLVAEVSFRGESYLYLRGQTWPMGDPQGRSQLRLLEISSRCVRLAHKEQHFDACVSS